MKTTDKDSNIKPTNDAVESEKLVNKPAEQQPVFESGVKFSQETADVAVGEQLDLALPESQIVAMADNAEDKESKRKDKKDKLEQDADQVAQPADEQAVEPDQSSGASEEAVEADVTSEVQGEVAEALAEQSAAKGFGVYLGAYSTPVLLLGSLGVLSALGSSSDKDDNKTPPVINDETPPVIIDETAPVITSSADAGSVIENSGAGQVIYSAEATDETSVVTFSLAQGSDAVFSIDSKTGAVTLNENPDFEAKDRYNFEIVATDEAGNQSQQKVSLAVTNIDDAAPIITSEASASNVTENSGARQTIYTASAVDSDQDVVSEPVTFSLADGTDDSLSIDASTGVVTLADNPDAESKPQYIFSVIATDALGNSSQKEVTLDINDIDDVAPVFTSLSSVAVDENSTLVNANGHQIIYTAVVDDSGDTPYLNDDGEEVGDKVEFSLVQGDLLNSDLGIDEKTGEVFTTVDLEYTNDDPVYSFTVLAQNYTLIDGGQPDNKENREYTPNTGVVQNISVRANNTIDNTPPEITSSATATAIEERSGENQVVYTAVADDSNDISNGITYSLAEGSDSALIIDSETGEVTLASNPDYEIKDSYSFTVVADDLINPAVQQAVSLEIINVDEAPPTIVPLADGVVLSVEENESNQIVYTAEADDSIDISAGVTFSLAEGQ
jgi:hypothetical protein